MTAKNEKNARAKDTDLAFLRTFYKLKTVERMASVRDRKESPAEHTWSAIVLADYFLGMPEHTRIDRLKVYELLLYHDLVEVEAGDTPLHPDYKDARPDERKAMLRLKDDLPSSMREKIIRLFSEYEDRKTGEAKFAKAIDALDAEIHELDYRQDWPGWTEAFSRKKKQHLFTEFPLLAAFYEDVLKYQRENGYFDH